MTPHEKQVMMFSATLSKEIRPVCKKFMNNVMFLSAPSREGVSCSSTSPGNGDCCVLMIRRAVKSYRSRFVVELIHMAVVGLVRFFFLALLMKGRCVGQVDIKLL